MRQLTIALPVRYNFSVEIQLSPATEAKISRLAIEQGRDANALVSEAVERFIDYDAWFVREVKKGMTEADAGHFAEHDEVGAL